MHSRFGFGIIVKRNFLRNFEGSRIDKGNKKEIIKKRYFYWYASSSS